MSKTNGNPTAEGTLSDELKSLLNPKPNVGAMLGPLSSKLNELLTTVSALIAPFSEVQKGASKLARAVGLAGQSIYAISSRLVQQNFKAQLSLNYDISDDEMMALQGNLMSSLQRNVQMDFVGTSVPGNANFDSTLENVVAASKLMPSTIGPLIAGYDKLGKSMKSAAKAVGKLYQEAGEYGINFTQYSENFVNNLEMAQAYNFKNGVDGLKEMARKATEVRQDMSQIANFANKVGSVTGAVETASRLQVLGGSFAALANPLAMLNESLTDMEGLQDRMLEMTKGAAMYDQTTHQITMDPVTRMRLRAAAEATGQDPNKLIDVAFAQERKAEIGRQMEGVGGFRADVAKMLENVGEIDSETGVAGATIGNQFYKLSDISGNEDLQNQLIAENRSQTDDVKQIAQDVQDISEKIGARQKQLTNAAARNTIREGMFGGKSAYGVASDLIVNRFGPEPIEGAANLDLFTTSLNALKTEVIGTLRTELLAPFAETTATGFGEKMGQAVLNILGENNITTPIAEGVSKLTTELATLADNIHNYTSDYGYGPLAAWRGGSGGVDGGAPITPADLPGSSSVSSAARDIATQASRISSENSATYFEPVTNQMTVIVNTLTQIKDGLRITGNEDSMPWATVAPLSADFYATSRRPAENGLTYNLNLSGTLTMNVNGDNGNIGTIDLMDQLENSKQLRDALTKAISDTFSKMAASGQIYNPTE